MAKRQVVFWVDEDILRGFDDWRMERRLPSRAAALVELMTKASGQRAVSEARVRSQARPSVIQELKVGLEREQAACPHPKDKRVVMSWGPKCGECNKPLR